MLHQRLGHAWPLHQADSPEPGFEERRPRSGRRLTARKRPV